MSETPTPEQRAYSIVQRIIAAEHRYMTFRSGGSQGGFDAYQRQKEEFAKEMLALAAAPAPGAPSERARTLLLGLCARNFVPAPWNVTDWTALRGHYGQDAHDLCALWGELFDGALPARAPDAKNGAETLNRDQAVKESAGAPPQDGGAA